ncbi:MAG: hypothetical protein SFV15_18285 [Polyangiaceae bacterium]|nr:hypothetical protein [Polyangiaceae bacterium]
MVTENAVLEVESKLNALVEAARYIVRSGQRTRTFMFEVEDHPEIAGLICFEPNLGTLTCQIEDGYSVLKFFLRYGAPNVSYTNLSDQTFEEVTCLFQASEREFPTLDSAFRAIVHGARALHNITEFQSTAGRNLRKAPQSGIEVRNKLQVFSLPGKRVA